MSKQIRVSISDHLARVIGRNLKLSDSTHVGLVLNAMYPEHLSYEEQDERILALIQGRIMIVETPRSKETTA